MGGALPVPAQVRGVGGVSKKDRERDAVSATSRTAEHECVSGVFSRTEHNDCNQVVMLVCTSVQPFSETKN